MRSSSSLTRVLVCAATVVACGRLGFDGGGRGDANPVAPAGMLLIPSDSVLPAFFIDQYEASIGPGNLGSVDQDQDGDGKLADPAVAAAMGYPYDNDGGETGYVPTTVVAASVPFVMPTGSISWYQAAAACVNAGKRLCTDQEWVLACGGPDHTIYTYDSNSYAAGMCNEGGGIAATGTHPGCTNAYGVYDMNGNVQEWTEWHPPTAVEYRGGAQDEGSSSSRCNYGNPAWPDTNVHPDIGFRCCKSIP